MNSRWHRVGDSARRSWRRSRGMVVGGECQRERVSRKGVFRRRSRLRPQINAIAWMSGQLAMRP
eukprot:4719981-Prorocentrum_lima.AAC.1